MSDLYLTLKNGMKMPRLGMGTWMLGEHLSIYQQEKKALQAGLDAGFTLIDTAEMYGNGLSEKLIGDTIQGYSREKLFLVSKVYPHNAGRPQIYDSIDQTLHNLKTDYLDMYLMSQCSHNIIANSSFSWWGAWLNQNPDKIVISPQRWFSHLAASDAICEDWVRVNG